jgi:Mg2+/Co2+ transporter CorC
MPKRGETINIDSLSFTVLRANKKRILLLRVSKITAPAEKETK